MKKVIFGLALVIGVFCTASFAASWQKVSQNTGSAPTNGLVAYYQCENNVLDTQGTYNGTASNVTYGAGKSGQACVFNGGSSYINIGNPMPQSGDFTVSFWSRGNSSGVVLARGYVSANGLLYGVAITKSATILSITKGIANPESSPYSVSVSTQSDTNYHLYSIVYQSGSIKIYIDADVLKNGSLPSSPVVFYGQYDRGVYALGVQDYVTGSTGFFSGALDSIRIYNRALSAAEVQAIYQAGN